MDKRFRPDKTVIQTAYPSPLCEEKVNVSDEEKITTITTCLETIMDCLGLDRTHPSLLETPRRVAKMYVNEVFSGLKEETFPELSIVEARKQTTTTQETVMTSVSFTSFCEHHLVPIFGTAYLAYIPEKYILGLSKMPRIVRYYSKRPQLQERLGLQIHNCLSRVLETENVAVVLVASHTCVTVRGVEDASNKMRTSVYTGAFKTEASRQRDFLNFINQ